MGVAAMVVAACSLSGAGEAEYGDRAPTTAGEAALEYHGPHGESLLRRPRYDTVDGYYDR